MTSSVAAVRESGSAQGAKWGSHALGPLVCQTAPARAIEASGCL